MSLSSQRQWFRVTLNDMRLGVFGGRFDPPHLGHLLAGQEALERLQLDALWFMPAQTPPHKAAQASPEDRYNMVLLATASHPQFRVSRLELERPGASYTFDTLTEVRRLQPTRQLFFITGLDAYRDVASWHRAEELASVAQMVTLSRPGYTLEGLAEPYRERVLTLETLECDISSTDIRARIQQKRPIRYLVPEPVETYIAKQHLYR